MFAVAKWWEVLGAAGTAVGAIAAAVGAIAAWRAASASRATSRDALEALAVGIRPRLRVQFPHVHRGDAQGQPLPAQIVAWVQNVSEWPARDLAFELRFRDGRVVRDLAERLEPAKGVEPFHGGAHWEVVLVPGEPGGPSLEQAGESAVLRYSDERHIARYEQTSTFVFRQTRKGTIVSTVSNIEIAERRI